jgi:cobalt/nickel transport system permease protein
VVVASIALMLQALFLAHGGLTTLGANLVSMGVVGSFAGYGVFAVLTRLGIPWGVAAFLAGALSDWATYATTSAELSLGLGLPILPILLAFVPTQLPLGLFEGMLTLGAFRFVKIHRPMLLHTAFGHTPVDSERDRLSPSWERP